MADSMPPEPILLAAAHIATFDGQRPLSGASGFFFDRDDRLFLVTSRHVLIDEPSKHFPDRIEIELHIEPGNLTRWVHAAYIARPWLRGTVGAAAARAQIKRRSLAVGCQP